MATGGCFCGKVRIHYSGQPILSVLCHCLDCRKLTGGLYTYNFAVNSADLEITGNPKAVPKTADSGNQIKNYFCPDCGTPLYGFNNNPNGDREKMIIVRAGIFDELDLLNRQPPQAEIYTDGRVKWIDPIPGADQFAGMLPLS